MMFILSQSMTGWTAIREDNEFTPFRNIINEWYAKDTSKKIRAVKRSKGMAGEHIGSHPPYGYRKNPENKKGMDRDEEAAEVSVKSSVCVSVVMVLPRLQIC